MSRAALALAWPAGCLIADTTSSPRPAQSSQLLNVALDNNKHAQGDAITAFGYLAKEAGPTGALRPYLPSIAQAIDAAFGKYQYKNIIKLYDAIAHLSDGVGAGGLADEQVLQTIMPPLIKRWQALADDDPDLRYLLEVSTHPLHTASDVTRLTCRRSFSA